LESVYYKTGKLNNLFRTPELELIAGQEGSSVVVKEEHCRFLLDIRKVYYCSRLQTERSRVLNLMNQGVLFDAFCGVGPFALQFAKRKNCIVLANDLNPECLYFFKQNQQINKVENKSIGFHSDARQFLKLMIKLVSLVKLYHSQKNPNPEIVALIDQNIFTYNVLSNLSGQQTFLNNWNLTSKQFIQASNFENFYVYMNLPGENIDFLDSLDFQIMSDILSSLSQFKVNLEFFVTCFEEIQENPDDIYLNAKNRIISKLSTTSNMSSGIAWKVNFKGCKDIKNVSSTKVMLCINFNLILTQKQIKKDTLLGTHFLEESSNLDIPVKKVKTE
jgi:tRNA (guanine37-N1)-methyltransferase